MANTYTLIASNTLSSSAASVTFSSIPGTYTDLVLRMSVRTITNSSSEVVLLRFNSDTTGNYSFTFLTGDGSTAASSRGSNQTYIYFSGTASGNGTSNTFSNAEIYIPSYTAAQNKSIGVFPVTENNATSTTTKIEPTSGLWRNTAAISSISILGTVGAGLATGSSFFLYGIKSS